MLHKRVLEWQAAHPTLTWIAWGIVWAVVLVLLFWPETLAQSVVQSTQRGSGVPRA